MTLKCMHGGAFELETELNTKLEIELNPELETELNTAVEV